MKTYLIYKLTSPSGKVYIGQTVNITQRFRQYSSLKCDCQPLICNSLKKYGWDTFIKEILYTGLTKLEANEKEIELIAKYKDEKISLNIQRGGNLVKDPYPIVQFSLNGELIKEWDSCETAGEELSLDPINIRAACWRGYNEQGKFLWLYKKDYEIGKIPKKSPVRIGEKVIQLTKEGKFVKEFDSISKVVETFDVNYTDIHFCLNGKQKSVSGYIYVYKDKYDESKDYSLKRKQRTDSQSVIQYDSEGNLVKEFSSIREAATTLNVPSTTIINACRPIQRIKRRKYFFKFKDYE